VKYPTINDKRQRRCFEDKNGAIVTKDLIGYGQYCLFEMVKLIKERGCLNGR
jgi:hypothetical protein